MEKTLMRCVNPTNFHLTEGKDYFVKDCHFGTSLVSVEDDQGVNRICSSNRFIKIPPFEIGKVYLRTDGRKYKCIALSDEGPIFMKVSPTNSFNAVVGTEPWYAGLTEYTAPKIEKTYAKARNWSKEEAYPFIAIGLEKQHDPNLELTFTDGVLTGAKVL